MKLLTVAVFVRFSGTCGSSSSELEESACFGVIDGRIFFRIFGFGCAGILVVEDPESRASSSSFSLSMKE